MLKDEGYLSVVFVFKVLVAGVPGMSKRFAENLGETATEPSALQIAF